MRGEEMIEHYAKEFDNSLLRDDGFIEYVARQAKLEFAEKIAGLVFQNEDAEHIFSYKGAKATENRERMTTILKVGVSVEELTRCKDCKSYDPDDEWCGKHELIMYAKDFCSYGKRRNDD